MFIHFPYSKQLKLGVCDGFSGHLCFQTHPTSATAMDSTSSQVLMPHRSDGLVGYHSYSLFRAYGDWALGPSTSSLNVASIQSTPIWFYHVLSCFICSSVLVVKYAVDWYNSDVWPSNQVKSHCLVVKS